MPSTPPLAGMLVADFSRVLAGPLCTMTLADLGATVVKVERPGSGDETRTWGPPFSARSTTYFDSVNRSKHSVALDLRDPADLEVAARLARRADVLVENFRPGTMARHGLGYEQVSATNPGVVYCSVNGFGSAAGAELPGYDFVVQAVGGLMSITGDADGEPMKVGVALVDVLTGKDATIGVLAALAARAQTGRGTWLEVSLLTSLLGALVNQAQGYLTTGLSPGRMGNQHPSIAPYETLRCRDGLLAVACGNDGQFAALATVLGLPELATDARFATNAARLAHRGALVAAMEAALSEQTAAAWQQRLTAAGVPAGGVGSVADAFALARDLGLAPTVDLGAGDAPQVRHPVRYGGPMVAQATPPPALGGDGTAIRSWLRDEEATLASLSRALGTPSLEGRT